VAVACKQCHWCAGNVGKINFWGNVGLLIIKLLGGIFGRSEALIADAVHSLSDVIVSVMFIIGLKVSAVPPDDDHRWGHGHVEFIISIVIGILLSCAAITIVVVALTSIFAGRTRDPGILAVWAACIAIITCELIHRQGICVGRQMNSPAMIAVAKEKRSDVLSSIAALTGAFGARIGFDFLDPAAAIVVAFMIARFGIETFVSGVRGITDASLEKEPMLSKVKELILKEQGVKDIGRLRARQIGQKRWIDIEAKFDPQMKVCDVKEAIADVKRKVMSHFEDVADIVIISRASEPELKEI